MVPGMVWDLLATSETTNWRMTVRRVIKIAFDDEDGLGEFLEATRQVRSREPDPGPNGKLEDKRGRAIAVVCRHYLDWLGRSTPTQPEKGVGA